MAVKSKNGVAALALIATAIFLFSGSMTAQTFSYSTIHSFGAPPRMGTLPVSRLLPDNKGHMYGTTAQGGAYGQWGGVIYEINTAGTERAIYSFTRGADGGDPLPGLMSDSDGNLYGVTLEGGDLTCKPPNGCGTIFKLDAARKLSVLHAFTEQDQVGFNWPSSLVRDDLGNFYGSLGQGGTSGWGTIFKLDALGNLTILYAFAGGVDGASPGNLILDKAGNLYGASMTGGSYGYGHVFKIDSAGNKTVLYNFTGGSDGVSPVSALTRDRAGNLYGATYGGGDPYHAATVFKINLQSHAFTSLATITDGDTPDAGLVIDSSGNIYGSCVDGGVFMIDTNGVYTNLHQFGVGSDGNSPMAGPIMDRAGNLYGTTTSGGAYGAGTVYKLTRQ